MIRSAMSDIPQDRWELAFGKKEDSKQEKESPNERKEQEESKVVVSGK